MSHTKIKVDSLKHPHTQERDGKTIYFVQYVTSSKLYDKQCTAEIYAKIKTQSLAYDGKKEIVLGLNQDTNIVDRVDVDQVKHSGFEVVADDSTPQAQRNTAIPYLIYAVMADGSVEMKAKPVDVSQSVAAEILDYVYDNHKKIKALDIILGKYLIADVRQDGQYIYVDPAAR